MDELTTIRRFYDLLASGDSAAALGLLHPDIEWTEAERTPYFAGTIHGVDAVVTGLFEPLAHDFDGFTTVPSDLLRNGSRVASFGRYTGTARSTGRVMSAPFVHLWTVEDGRLRRFTQFTDSVAWNEALATNDQDTPALDGQAA
jgi:ketosteroid isomerase-like protein